MSNKLMSIIYQSHAVQLMSDEELANLLYQACKTNKEKM